MKQENKRLYSIAFAALLVVGALVVYFELIVPAYGDLLNAKSQNQGDVSLYNNEKQIVDEVHKLQTSYQNQTAAIQAVDMALPVGQNLAGGLAQVYGLAGESGVIVQGTTISLQAIQQPVAVPAAASGGGQIQSAALAGSIKKPAGTITFTIIGSGSYEAIKTFLRGLETNVRIFDVQSIMLANAAITGTKTSAGNPDFFNYTITVASYYQSP
jgi:hypothetical protein